MKVLLEHTSPFALAHGGLQVQIEQTKAALERRGVEVEYVRWWDEQQTGDLIHHFMAPPVGYIDLARAKGIPSVITHLFTGTCNRSPKQLQVQALLTKIFSFAPSGIKRQLHWEAFRSADKMVVGLHAEERVLQTVYNLPSSRISTVPLGLHQDFLKAGAGSRSEKWLITTGTITERKRSVELARMAKDSGVPILFVGKPYNAGSSYAKEFLALVDDQMVLHHDHIDDRSEMIRLLQSSRGFVIFSQRENWCLSAHEAIACGLPVLVQDQPWSRECFGDSASYLDNHGGPTNNSRLRSFYDESPRLSPPSIHLYSWDEVAEKLEECYRTVL